MRSGDTVTPPLHTGVCSPAEQGPCSELHPQGAWWGAWHERTVGRPPCDDKPRVLGGGGAGAGCTGATAAEDTPAADGPPAPAPRLPCSTHVPCPPCSHVSQCMSHVGPAACMCYCVSRVCSVPMCPIVFPASALLPACSACVPVPHVSCSECPGRAGLQEVTGGQYGASVLGALGGGHAGVPGGDGASVPPPGAAYSPWSLCRARSCASMSRSWSVSSSQNLQ